VSEEHKYLDELFQSKFAAFEAEPPASVWDNIHNKLHGNNGGPINPVNLAILAALIMISGWLGFSLINNSSTEGEQPIMSEGHTAMLFEDPDLMHPGALELPEVIEQRIAVISEEQHVPGEAGEGTEKSVEKAPESIQPHNSLHQYYVNTTFGDAFSEKEKLARLRARNSNALYSGLFLNIDGIQVRDSRYNPRFSGVNDGERKYNRRASWQLGIFFTPEVVFYPDDSIPNQRSYTFEATGRWVKNEFFIESGLGLSFSSDDGNYAIDYEKFLGSYDDVYNVTFDTTESGAVVPIYHTNLVNVYDSIDRYKVEQTKNRYTYLQIPVYIGFQKEVNRFGWFIKGGPILSLLIHENIPEPDAGNDKIISVDRQMPGRVNSTWQLGFSAGMTYQLSPKVSIAIEPTFRYYLSSQYQRKYITTRHPYSVGLRTGLLFNF
jgi:hypothetical protein